MLPTFCYIVTTREDVNMLAMAHASILSLLHIHPGADVRLFVDSPTTKLIDTAYPGIRDAVNGVVEQETDLEAEVPSSRYLKTKLRSLVDGDFVFLDIDTVVLRDISALWDHDCTLAGVQDDNTKGGRFSEELLGRFRELGWVEPEEPYLNGGVLFWRDNDEGRRLGDAWYTYWKESRPVMYDTDQPPLHQAIRTTNVSVKVLPEDYNQKVRDCPQNLREPAILHWTTRGALNRKYNLINHLLRYVQEHGALDVAAVERARDRNDPWVAPGPGIKGNWHTGRYLAAAREAWKRVRGVK